MTKASYETRLRRFLKLYNETASLAIPLSEGLHNLSARLLEFSRTRRRSSEARISDPVLFRFFLSLLSPPAFPHCILLTIRELQLCVMDLMITEGLAPRTRALITSSLKRFDQALRQMASSSEEPSPKDRRSFTQERYPVWCLYLHYKTHRTDSSYQPFSYLAPHLTRWLHIRNQLQHKNYAMVAERKGQSVLGLQAKRFAWYVRQARTLINEFPVHRIPPKLPARCSLSSNDPDLHDKPVARKLIRLFYERDLISRARGHISWKALSATEIQATLLTDDIAQSVHAPVIRIGSHPRQGDFDSSAIPKADQQELQISVRPLHQDMERIRTARAILNRSREIARCRAAMPYLYDIRVLQMPTLADLLRRLPVSVPLDAARDSDLIPSTIALIAMLTGQPPANILNMSVSQAAPPKDGASTSLGSSVHLTYLPASQELQYFWPDKWLGYSGRNDLPFFQRCTDTTCDIRIPLPSPLDELLAECHRRLPRSSPDSSHPHDLKLFHHHLASVPQKEQERALDRWLNQLCPPQHGRLTLRRLGRSFVIQAMQRYGMDPILAAYVARQFWWHIRSPLQYTAFPSHRLYTTYRAITTQFLADVDQHITATSQEWPTRGLFLPRPNVTNAQVTPRESAISWYGSRCVPETRYLQHYFGALIRAIEDLRGYKHASLRVWRHNYFTLLTYHAWEYGTLTRPRVFPQINWDRVDLPGRRSLISDKDSQYPEVRLMPMPPTASELIETLLKQVNPETMTMLQQLYSHRSMPKLSDLDTPFCFLVEQKGTGLFFRSLSPSHIQWLLEKGPLRHHFPNVFYPANVHRHYVRSFLFNAIQADFEAINYAMSHKHFGFEPYNVYAGTDTAPLHQQLTTWLEQCIQEIGIRPLRWGPH